MNEGASLSCAQVLSDKLLLPVGAVSELIDASYNSFAMLDCIVCPAL